jgi:pimeloyl-ACP methyl ester carboxylesterase
VGPGLGYLYQLAAGAGWTSLPRLPLLRKPTLILAGDDDPIIPLINARVMAGLIPGARLQVYHGGHVELVLQPDLLAPIVAEFLAGGTDDQRR